MAVPLYTDDNWRELIGDGVQVEHAGVMRPLAARPTVVPFGRIVGAPAVTAFQLIPRAVWDDLIAYKDQQNSWLEQIARDKVSCEDQGDLNLCHAASTCEAARCRYAVMGDAVPALTFTSIGMPVTGWRNAGADIADDWKQLRDYGACTTDFLPDGVALPPQSRGTNALLMNQRKYKTGWQANAKLHCEAEGIDLGFSGSLFDAAATACFLNIPFACAFSWWSHAICGGFRVLKLGTGKYALRYRNNWGASYGDNGFLDLAEGKGTPDWGAIGNLGMTPIASDS
jgi:hypothetical protein